MKKLFIMAIMLITSLCANSFTGNKQEGTNYFANEIIADYTEESLEIEKGQELNQVQEETELVIDEPTQELESISEIEQETVIEEPSVEEVPVTPKEKTEPKVYANAEEKEESTPKQETYQEEFVPEQPKQEEKVEIIAPKQEEKVYCVDGGEIHIAGDGANEHGYYKTWDEAFDAYEKYTEGWESSHFKINQCFCGLYYFSVTK